MNKHFLLSLKEYASVHASLKRCIETSPDKPIVFFEVGCMDGSLSGGFYSMVMQNGRSDNRYFAFEPYSRNYIKITKNPNFPANAEVVNKALNSKTGVFDLFCSSGKTKGNPNEYEGCSSLLEPQEVTVKFPFIKFNSTEPVECITIDDFCKEKHIDAIDFVYADIQGAEGDMITGAQEMMNNIKFMFLEKSDIALYKNQPLTKDLIAIMETNGFEVAKEFKYDILFYNKNIIK